ncbi:GLPGLI family protein [Riemerella columbipharyngis]|uniref:GLPGLI family protein n=1 Tax=Riemerella columbipharyngis TaxID=1071918 RepID=A0A1G7C313_9FLAO|nr:GLPGLI family protein [Riemerella columbipharyngis]SDE33160.1 GLPGLI family protein [Riemerella columbipharyngis]
MLKKTPNFILLIFLMFFCFVNAQHFEIKYNVLFKDSKARYNYILDIKDSNSDFYLLKKNNFIPDSLSAQIHKINCVLKRNEKLFLYSNQKQFYLISPFKSIKSWDIVNNTITENNFQLGEAHTKYKDLFAKALYIKDIPLSDGPFIFKNLPGLIYKIDTPLYTITLSEIKKDDKTLINVEDTKHRKEVSEEKFIKFQKESKEKEDLLFGKLRKVMKEDANFEGFEAASFVDPLMLTL